MSYTFTTITKSRTEIVTIIIENPLYSLWDISTIMRYRGFSVFRDEKEEAG